MKLHRARCRARRVHGDGVRASLRVDQRDGVAPAVYWTNFDGGTVMKLAK
jgi:hypothetical protein